MVVGQDQKALSVLIVPSYEHFRQAGVNATSAAELQDSPEARQLMEADIRQFICHEKGFKSFERISEFRFVPKSFEVGEEMTNTFKLKRHIIAEKYRPLIDSMYS
jgi:long-chain acyl-CoA synthetase